MQAIDKDGQLPGSGSPERAIDADQIAEIELLGDPLTDFSNLFLPDHDLDGAGPVFEIQEMGLPHTPAQDDAPRRPNPRGRHTVIWQFSDAGNGLMPIKALAPWINAQ